MPLARTLYCTQHQFTNGSNFCIHELIQAQLYSGQKKKPTNLWSFFTGEESITSEELHLFLNKDDNSVGDNAGYQGRRLYLALFCQRPNDVGVNAGDDGNANASVDDNTDDGVDGNADASVDSNANAGVDGNAYVTFLALLALFHKLCTLLTSTCKKTKSN
ncbi:hypothetical protein F8M41_000588 [Gigaspora margarita]|uniref:Uncharacterized protein n=1 Tax=Gigaspora margarita TaxID=4874 RepID=A0A8H3XHR0_GIGMA|nr:hypothetical protein F8M41_000588 [Gigaspora margarita]